MNCSLPQCIAADGYLRAITTINRMLPGPAIEVCRGDTIVVDVENRLPSESISIHWHGIPQKGTQYYDGVPYITQCPIGPSETFRYKFKAEPSGTFFYHSHSGLQKLDGLSGPLVIRDKPTAYKEYIVFIQDWMHTLAMVQYPGLQRGPQPYNMPFSYLINGKGVFIGVNKTLNEIAAAVNTPNQPPVETFLVKQGETYRMRLISGTCSACMFSLFIQGHIFYLISEDGGKEIEPQKTDTIFINSAERFDILLEANQKTDSYWIAIQGFGLCAGVKQLGILRYEGGPDKPSANGQILAPGPLTINAYNPTCNSSEPNNICISQLKSINPVPPELKRSKGDLQILVRFGIIDLTVDEIFYSGQYTPYLYTNMGFMRHTVNNVTFTFPPSPLISQYKDIPEDAFCKPHCYKSASERCKCTSIIKIPMNAVVDVVLADFNHYVGGNRPSHPYHLHGYSFYVLEAGMINLNVTMNEGIKDLFRRLDKGELRNPTAPMKDTVSLPAGGYVVMRFVANNPGFWFAHCHYLYHLESGMGTVFHVGELSDLPPIPKGFPTCNNFIPPIKNPNGVE